MTASIDNSQDLRLHARAAEREPASTVTKLIRGVQVVAGGTALAGVGALTGAFVENEWRVAVVGYSLLLLSAVAGSVLVINALLADRNVFYQRGKADGYYEGWRGMPPTVDDPLLRR